MPPQYREHAGTILAQVRRSPALAPKRQRGECDKERYSSLSRNSPWPARVHFHGQPRSGSSLRDPTWVACAIVGAEPAACMQEVRAKHAPKADRSAKAKAVAAEMAERKAKKKA